jgi:hypothetical protein
MLIFQFDQEKLDSQDININPEVLAFWNGYIEQSKNGFVLLPPYINYIGNTEENMSNYDLQFIPIDDDGGDLTF